MVEIDQLHACGERTERWLEPAVVAARPAMDHHRHWPLAHLVTVGHQAGAFHIEVDPRATYRCEHAPSPVIAERAQAETAAARKTVLRRPRMSDQPNPAPDQHTRFHRAWRDGGADVRPPRPPLRQAGAGARSALRTADPSGRRWRAGGDAGGDRTTLRPDPAVAAGRQGGRLGDRRTGAAPVGRAVRGRYLHVVGAAHPRYRRPPVGARYRLRRCTGRPHPRGRRAR